MVALNKLKKEKRKMRPLKGLIYKLLTSEISYFWEFTLHGRGQEVWLRSKNKNYILNKEP